MSRSLVEVHRRFGETFCLHVQGRNVIQARNQQKAGGKQSVTFQKVAFIVTAVITKIQQFLF
jgi:hypothetical protein